MFNIWLMLLWLALFVEIGGNWKHLEDPGRTELDSSIQYIVGGSYPPFKLSDFLVSIQTKDQGHFCGGSLLTGFWILTAAHCSIVNSAPRPPFSCLAIAGSRNFVYNVKELSVRSVISHFVVHPEFNYSTSAGDVACARTVKEFREIPDRISFVNLTLPEEVSTDDVRILVVVGWGLGSKEFNLRSANLTAMKNDDCQIFVPGLNHETQICTFDDFKVDSCFGDGGSPLFFIHHSSSREVFYQYAIVSHGAGCGLHNLPSVNTRIAAFLPFIECVTADKQGTCRMAQGVLPGSNRLLLYLSITLTCYCSS